MNKENTIQQVQDEAVIKQVHDDRQPLPCYSIFLVVLLIAIYIFQHSYQIYSRFLQCNIFALLNYKVWTIITTCFSDYSFAIVFLVIASCKTFFARFESKNASVILFYQIFAISIGIQVILLGIQAALFALLWITQNRIQISKIRYEEWQLHILRTSVGMGAVWINMVYKICNTLASDRIGYVKPFFNMKCSRISKNLKILPWIIFLITIQMTFIGLKSVRYDIVLGFLLAIIECAFFKGGLVKYTLQTYVVRQKWARYFGMEKWNRFVSFVIVDYEQNKYMALESLQFYENMIRKVNNRHHMVDSYAGYQKNAEEVGLTASDIQQQ